MSTKLFQSNIEQGTYLVVNDTSVNPVPMNSVSVTSVSDPDGNFIEIEMAGAVTSAGYPGALVAFELPIPVQPGVNFVYSGLDAEFYLDSASLSILRCLEFDDKQVWTPAPNPTTPIANCMNGSGQWNKTQNCWQIDDASGAWVSTPYAPVVKPDRWFPISTRYWRSLTSYSVIKVSIGDTEGIVPLQAVPLLSTNWATTLNVQIQLCLQQSGTATLRLKNLTRTLSDQPF